NNCIFTKAPTLTVIAGLVLLVLLLSVMSEAVSVCEPAVLKVALKALVPVISAASAGNTALVSVELMSTMSLTVAIRFQNASTALTRLPSAAPTRTAGGAPAATLAVAVTVAWVLTVSLIGAEEPTVMAGLVLAVLVPAVMSVAVTVCEPAVLSVPLKALVPATN